MAEKIRVQPLCKGALWYIREEGEESRNMPIIGFDFRGEAVEYGRFLAKTRECELFIHNEKGSIEKVISFINRNNQHRIRRI